MLISHLTRSYFLSYIYFFVPCLCILLNVFFLWIWTAEASRVWDVDVHVGERERAADIWPDSLLWELRVAASSSEPQLPVECAEKNSVFLWAARWRFSWDSFIWMRQRVYVRDTNMDTPCLGVWVHRCGLMYGGRACTLSTLDILFLPSDYHYLRIA